MVALNLKLAIPRLCAVVSMKRSSQTTASSLILQLNTNEKRDYFTFFVLHSIERFLISVLSEHSAHRNLCLERSRRSTIELKIKSLTLFWKCVCLYGIIYFFVVVCLCVATSVGSRLLTIDKINIIFKLTTTKSYFKINYYCFCYDFHVIFFFSLMLCFVRDHHIDYGKTISAFET